MFPSLEVVMSAGGIPRELSQRKVRGRIDFQARQVPVQASAAMILLASSTGMSGSRSRARAQRRDARTQGDSCVQREGFGSLDPDYRGGRPRKTTPAERDRIVAAARTRPTTRRPVDALVAAQAALALGREGRRALEEALRQTLIGGGSPTSARARGSGAGPGVPTQGRARAFALQSQARGRRGRYFDEMGRSS